MKIQNNGWAMGDGIRNTNDNKVVVAKEDPVNGVIQSTDRWQECLIRWGGLSLFPPDIYGSYASTCAAR